MRDRSGGRHDRWVDFGVQASANAVGTLATGLVLGSFAVRVGVFDANDETLQLTADYAFFLGVLFVALLGIAALVLAALIWIQPERRSSHEQTLYRIVQVGLGVGAIATTVFWAVLSIAYWDPEGVLVWAVSVAACIGAIVIVRALAARRAGGRTGRPAGGDKS